MWNIVEHRVPITILINKCLTICFIDRIFTTSKMMTARIWSTYPENVEGRRRFVSPQIANEFAGTFRRFLPNRRDREVPYGMKGGELDGHEEEGS